MQTQLKATWRESPPILACENCTICHGTGWELLPISGSSRARRCSCSVLSRLVKLKEGACIPQRYEHCSLDNFTPHTLSQTRALVEARKFAEKYPDVDSGLFLTGAPGVGKTHLAVGIIRDLLQRFQEDVLFVDFGEVLDPQALACQRNKIGIAWNRLKNVSLLVLDNFGLAAPSAENLTVVEGLLSVRLQSRRSTVFTGECVRCRELFRDTAIARADASRTQVFLAGIFPPLLLQLLAGMRVLTIVGEDFRQRTARTARFF